MTQSLRHITALCKVDTQGTLQYLVWPNCGVKGKGKVIPLQPRCGPEGG